MYSQIAASVSVSSTTPQLQQPPASSYYYSPPTPYQSYHGGFASDEPAFPPAAPGSYHPFQPLATQRPPEPSVSPQTSYGAVCAAGANADYGALSKMAALKVDDTNVSYSSVSQKGAREDTKGSTQVASIPQPIQLPPVNLVFDRPILFIEKLQGRFRVTEEAKLLIGGLGTKKLKVVGVIGEYRTGKSYLMNRLLCQRTGFDLGHEVEGKTRGIWMWGIEPPEKDPKTLLMCFDTEGLFDFRKSETYDYYLFCLSIFASSYLILNTVGVVSRRIIEVLCLITEIIKSFEIKGHAKDLFPTLLFLARDAHLSLGQHTDEAAYLQNVLRESTINRQSAADILKKLFPNSCYRALPSPSANPGVHQQEGVETRQRARFEEELHKLTNWIRTSARVKATGKEYIAMMENCCQVLNAFVFPEMNSYEQIVAKKLESALDGVRDRLETVLKPLASKFPMDESELGAKVNDAKTKLLQELTADVKEEELREAIKEKMENELAGVVHQYEFENEKKSSEQFAEVLERLINDIQDKSTKQQYDSMNAFEKDVTALKKKFNTKTKGPGKERALKEAMNQLALSRVVVQKQLEIKQRLQQ